MKISLICQSPTAAGGHMKENLCVSDIMFTLCMCFSCVGIECKVFCLVASISTNTGKDRPSLPQPYSSWGTHEREPVCK